MGAGIVVFPEMWSNGYGSERSSDGHVRFSGPPRKRGDSYVAAFQEAAVSLGVSLVITYLESAADGLRNSATLIDARGRIALHYSKVHTCAFDEPESFLAPGDALDVCEIDTPAGPVTVGILICFDREFPESARELARNGAELILVPNCCELEQHRLAQLEARAFENMAAIAVANYAAPKANGRSVLFDGMAFDDSGRSRKMRVSEGGEDEAVIAGPIDLAALRKYRQEEPWGEKWRRAELYSELSKRENRT